jgi:hypothetical protein
MNTGFWPDYLQLPKASWLQKLLVILIVSWMAAYPIYTSFYKAYGVDQYRRHLMHMKGESMFLTPGNTAFSARCSWKACTGLPTTPCIPGWKSRD